MNAAAERGVLSGICKFGKDGYLEVSDLITSSVFQVDSNKGLYTCLSHIFEKKIDSKIDLHLIFATATELGISYIFDNDRGYLDKILNFSVEFDNIRGMAQTIRKLQIARELRDKHKEAEQELVQVDGSERLSEIIAISENKILDYTNSLTTNTNEQVTLISDGLEDYLKAVSESPQEMVGISTGHGRLDVALGGALRRQGVYVVAARPGIGKTLLADGTATHVAGKLNIPVLVLDTEMNKISHWPRILAAMTHVKINDIETGKFSYNETARRKINTATKLLKNMPYSYINVSGRSFEEVLAITRRWIMQTVGFDSNGRTNDCLMIYDYLKLMNDKELKTGVMKEHQILGFQMTQLHDFTVKYDIPCLAFVQVNRDGITKETSDIIADSDRILRLASAIALYKVKTPEEIAEDKPENGNRKMILIKARYGAGLDDEDYINFQHTKDIALIKELRTRNELKRGCGSQKGFQVENADERTDF